MTIDLRHISSAEDPVCADIAKLWTYYIEHSTITFNPVPKTKEDIQASVAQKSAAKEPMIAAFQGGNFLGFATYGPFRGGEGYKYVKEHTIMLSDDARGTGLGRQLMAALEEHAKTHDIQSLWAGITGSNKAAIGFHTRLGFAHVVTVPEIGWKFDQWHDLVLMRKRLR